MSFELLLFSYKNILSKFGKIKYNLFINTKFYTKLTIFILNSFNVKKNFF